MRAVDDDPDTELVPAVVAQIVAKGAFLPMLDAAWDPAAPEQAAAVRAVLAELVTFATPALQQHFAPVVTAVRSGVERAAQACAVPAWPPAALRASPRAAVAAHVAWGRATALLAAVCTFQGLLAADLLQELVSTRLLSQQIVPAAAACVAEAERGGAFAAAVAARRLAAAAAALTDAWRTGKSAGVLQLRALAARVVRVVGTGAVQPVRDDVHALRTAFAL